MDFSQKYLKYRNKYLSLKNSIKFSQMNGGGLDSIVVNFKLQDWVCVNGLIQLKKRDPSITIPGLINKNEDSYKPIIKNIYVNNLLARIINNPKENSYDVYIPEPFFQEEINNGFRSQAFNISGDQIKLLQKFNVGDNIKNIDNYNNAKIIRIIPPPHGDMVEQYEIEYDNKSKYNKTNTNGYILCELDEYEEQPTETEHTESGERVQCAQQ
jgi:hypothetical protein